MRLRRCRREINGEKNGQKEKKKEIGTTPVEQAIKRAIASGLKRSLRLDAHSTRFSDTAFPDDGVLPSLGQGTTRGHVDTKVAN